MWCTEDGGNLNSQRGNETQSSPGFHLHRLISILFYLFLLLLFFFFSHILSPLCPLSSLMLKLSVMSCRYKRFFEPNRTRAQLRNWNRVSGLDLVRSDCPSSLLSCLFLLCLSRRVSVFQLPSCKHTLFVWPSKYTNMSVSCVEYLGVAAWLLQAVYGLWSQVLGSVDSGFKGLSRTLA